MLKDRAHGIQETLFHDPYHQRHVVGAPVVRETSEGRLRCEANYAVFRTKLSELSTVYNVGRYLDVVVRTPQGLKFASRECLHDKLPNDDVWPVTVPVRVYPVRVEGGRVYIGIEGDALG
jgi:salicylate 5-hydroxylase small subunit